MGEHTGTPKAALVSWWARRSLRARLTAAASVLITAGMVIAAILLVWRVHSSLVANLDSAVTTEAQTMARQAEQGTLPRSLPDSGDGTPRVQVIAASGRVLSASTNVDHPFTPLFAIPGRLGDARWSRPNRLGTVTGPTG